MWPQWAAANKPYPGRRVAVAVPLAQTLRSMKRPWLAWLLPALLLTGGVVLLARQFPQALSDQSDRIGLTAGLLWAILLFGTVVVQHRSRGGEALGAAAFWLLAAALLVLGYAYRYEAQDMGRALLAELVPSMGQRGSEAEMVFRADRNGHFSVQGEVEGVPVRFLVDTGASDVVLTMADAKRLGLDPSQLRFTLPYRTANGVIRAAAARLKAVTIGDITIENVEASVNPSPMQQSLLGMSFLARLSGYEITRNTLTMRQ